MAASNNFSHDGSGGESFKERMSWGCDRYSYAGEIIAWGYSDPQSVVEGWLNSPPHHDILLNGSYSAAGAGYGSSEAYGPFWTVDFIAQAQAQSLGFELERASFECRTFTERVGEGTIMATICD
jgi:uncharacterized protein YkwD